MYNLFASYTKLQMKTQGKEFVELNLYVSHLRIVWRVPLYQYLKHSLEIDIISAQE